VAAAITFSGLFQLALEGRSLSAPSPSWVAGGAVAVAVISVLTALISLHVRLARALIRRRPMWPGVVAPLVAMVSLNVGLLAFATTWALLFADDPLVANSSRAVLVAAVITAIALHRRRRRLVEQVSLAAAPAPERPPTPISVDAPIGAWATGAWRQSRSLLALSSWPVSVTVSHDPAGRSGKDSSWRLGMEGGEASSDARPVCVIANSLMLVRTVVRPEDVAEIVAFTTVSGVSIRPALDLIAKHTAGLTGEKLTILFRDTESRDGMFWFFREAGDLTVDVSLDRVGGGAPR
jgi:hypothetical protein